MRSRRQLLTGLGTLGVASLAGCSGLPFGEDDDRSRPEFDVPADAIQTLEWPASPFPVALPDALANTHRKRARELLDGVPAAPSVPNQAVAEELRSDRERAADRLGEDPDEPWPVDELSQWRSRRGSAANVAGAYRAATGEDDAATVAERNRTVRSTLGSVTVDHDYRAETVREAVLVHAPIEELLATTRRRSRPDPDYPADPVAEPFLAGDAFAHVEIATAAIDDARRLRETYLAERSAVRSQWGRLIDAADRLRFAVARTQEPIAEFLDTGHSAFDRDLDRTVAYHLFSTGARQVRSAEDAFEDDRDDGAYATSVVDAGEALAAMEALRAAIEGIRNDGYQGEVTVDSIRDTAERAHTAIDAICTAEDGSLAAMIGRPALSRYDSMPEWVEGGYGEPLRLQGELAWVELYARVVPAATAFVAERLNAAGGE